MKTLKDNLVNGFQSFLPVSAIYVAFAIALRLYECLLIIGKPEISPSAFLLELRGIVFDFPFLFGVASIVAVIHLAAYLISAKFSKCVTIFLFTVLLLADIGLMHYFAVTLLPLSADLFGYTWADISTTVLSSQAFSIFAILLPVLVLLLFVWLTVRINPAVRHTILWLAASTMVVSWGLPHAPTPEKFDRDLDYYIAVDKTQFFISRSIDYVHELTSNEYQVAPGAYPFLNSVQTGQLSDYFRIAEEQLPNFVFIIVEGLGRDFTGPNAQLGGFTPFLDSLADHSLYWKNFLSNGGRTFAVLPSILGSLPYGQNGFMSYGPDLPDHQTLITLLRQGGYKTNFFYGGRADFDGQDLFLEFQQTDRMLDVTQFENNERLQYWKNAGFSWGYPDHEVFQEALLRLKDAGNGPRLDLYLTLSTHEPFFIPDPKYQQVFEKLLTEKKLTEEQKASIKINQNIFSCLVYADESIRKLIEGYSKRGDFGRTIFIITGDHRLIPIPQRTKLARYHVPLMIYSPLLLESKKIGAIGVHSDLMLTLLGLLAQQYHLSFPKELAHISGPLRFEDSLTSSADIALIRNKGEVRDYVEGTYFLSEERLYAIQDNFELVPLINDKVKSRLKQKLKQFNAQSRYAIETNHLDRLPAGMIHKKFFISTEDLAWIKSLNLPDGDSTFRHAQQLAFGSKYTESRVLLRHLLNNSPNYHDGRILLARTFAWQGQYDSARTYLNQTIARSAAYLDAYLALADVEFWSDNPQKSLDAAQQGLKFNRTDKELQARVARALIGLKRMNEARVLLNDLKKKYPTDELVADLLKKIK